MSPATSHTPPRLCMPLAEWPATDRDRWLADMQPVDLLMEESITSDWSAAHRENVECAYGDWLAWLSHHGLLDPKAAPHERLNPERLKLYRVELSSRLMASSVAIMVQRIGAMMRVLEPDRDWGWLQVSIANLRRWAAAVGPQPKKVVSLQDLLQLGFDLMEVQAAASSRPLDAARLYRDGLMIALLAQRPMRRSNLCQIRLGTHLVESAGKLWLRFTPEETKNGRPLEYRWPESLELPFRQYLAVYRPRLLAERRKGTTAPGTALWISCTGTMLRPNSVHARVAGLTRKRFGFPISPHLFRTCIGTDVAENDPEHVYILAPVLGHANLKTTYKYYIQAESFKATQDFAAAMSELSRPLPAKRRLHHRRRHGREENP